MSKVATLIKGIVLSVAACVFITGCWESKTENAVEDMGEQVEESAEKAGDKIEDAADKASEKVEDATH
jgi:hypothetical protein